MELDEAREQLVDLYSKGYGGVDAAGKIKRVKEDIAESDKLLDDLANLML